MYEVLVHMRKTHARHDRTLPVTKGTLRYLIDNALQGGVVRPEAFAASLPSNHEIQIKNESCVYDAEWLIYLVASSGGKAG